MVRCVDIDKLSDKNQYRTILEVVGRPNKTLSIRINSNIMALTPKIEQFNRIVLHGLRNFMHLFAATHFWYAIWYDFNFVYPPKGHAAYDHMRSFGGKFRYLTILGAVMTQN